MRLPDSSGWSVGHGIVAASSWPMWVMGRPMNALSASLEGHELPVTFVSCGADEGGPYPQGASQNGAGALPNRSFRACSSATAPSGLVALAPSAHERAPDRNRGHEGKDGHGERQQGARDGPPHDGSEIALREHQSLTELLLEQPSVNEGLD